MAKYFTSRSSVRAASDAVQIRGPRAVTHSSPFLAINRDANIMEIIEGTLRSMRIFRKDFVDQSRPGGK